MKVTKGKKVKFAIRREKTEKSEWRWRRELKVSDPGGPLAVAMVKPLKGSSEPGWHWSHDGHQHVTKSSQLASWTSPLTTSLMGGQGGQGAAPFVGAAGAVSVVDVDVFDAGDVSLSPAAVGSIKGILAAACYFNLFPFF